MLICRNGLVDPPSAGAESHSGGQRVNWQHTLARLRKNALSRPKD